MAYLWPKDSRKNIQWNCCAKTASCNTHNYPRIDSCNSTLSEAEVFRSWNHAKRDWICQNRFAFDTCILERSLKQTQTRTAHLHWQRSIATDFQKKTILSHTRFATGRSPRFMGIDPLNRRTPVRLLLLAYSEVPCFWAINGVWIEPAMSTISRISANIQNKCRLSTHCSDDSGIIHLWKSPNTTQEYNTGTTEMFALGSVQQTTWKV